MIDVNIKVSYHNQLNNDGTMDLVLTHQTVFVEPTGSVKKMWFWITISGPHYSTSYMLLSRITVANRAIVRVVYTYQFLPPNAFAETE